jgi:hypothetical protein
VDGQVDPVIRSGDLDDGQAGMTGMPHRVGDGFLGDFLGDAVQRGLDRGAHVVRDTGDVHPDARLATGRACQPPDVGEAAQGSQLRVVPVAQGTHHGPHLGQSTGALHLDDLQCLDRGDGPRLRDHPPGLGPDHHRRDVVRHRVMQVAGQQFPFPQPALLQLA